MSGPRKRVVAFISGGGSNMLALARACEAADYPAEIVAVFSDKADAGDEFTAREVHRFSHFLSLCHHEVGV